MVNGNFKDLLPQHWESLVDSWLEDDIPSFDVGGFVVGEKQEECWLLGKSNGVLAGVPFFDEVFKKLGCTVEWLMCEGDVINTASTPNGKVVVAKVRGPINRLLQGERTGLNIITRASGIATSARAVVELVRSRGWEGMVAGTRKTTPGFRLVEKYALLVGGAASHRYDLSQMVMLKDNHVWSTGSITGAVAAARRGAGFSQKIEVEARSLAEAQEAAAAGADVVMLDNMSGKVLQRCAAQLKGEFPHVLVEASGGITEATILDYISPQVDVVSLGKLTQGYGCLDFSLKVQRSSDGGGDSAAAAAAAAVPATPAAAVVGRSRL